MGRKEEMDRAKGELIKGTFSGEKKSGREEWGGMKG